MADQQASLMLAYYHCVSFTINEVTSAVEPLEEQLEMSEGEEEYIKNTIKITRFSFLLLKYKISIGREKQHLENNYDS